VIVGFGCLTASVLLALPWLLVPFALAWASLARLDPRALRSLARWRLWIVLGAAGLVPVLLLARPDTYVLGLGIPSAGLRMTAAMIVRVMTATAALLLIGGTVGPMVIRRVLVRLGSPHVAQACAIGLNLMPKLVENFRRTSLALRLRGGWRRRRIRNTLRLLTTVGIQTVRTAEECAEALLLAHPQRPHGETASTPPEPGS